MLFQNIIGLFTPALHFDTCNTLKINDFKIFIQLKVDTSVTQDKLLIGK